MSRSNKYAGFSMKTPTLLIQQQINRHENTYLYTMQTGRQIQTKECFWGFIEKSRSVPLQISFCNRLKFTGLFWRYDQKPVSFWPFDDFSPSVFLFVLEFFDRVKWIPRWSFCHQALIREVADQTEKLWHVKSYHNHITLTT